MIKDQSTIKTALVEPGTLVYSGLYVVVANPTIGQKMINILKTSAFVTYVKLLAQYKASGYYTFGAKDLSQFINFMV